jgi:type IV secretory pathway VirJ component
MSVKGSRIFRQTLLVGSLAVVSVTVAAQTPALSSDNLKDLPIREIPAAGPSRNSLVLFITGDGGWAEIDKTVTRRLADRGFSVVGVDSRAYLRQKRSPERLAQDMGRILRYYGTVWNASTYAIVGYSRGADLAPFVVTRLDSVLKSRVAMIAMIGLGPRAGFEFHFEDIFLDVKRADDLPTVSELQKLAGLPMLCVYGVDEKESGCRDASSDIVRKVERPGGHHFGGDYDVIGNLIADFFAESVKH